MAFADDTLQVLMARARRESSVGDELKRDMGTLANEGWVRLKNGSFVKRAALEDPRNAGKNTFYFAAYRELVDDPGLRGRILEFIEPVAEEPRQ